MMRLGKAFYVVTAITLALSGCGIVQTYKHPGNIMSTDKLEKDGEGFSYFLPRRRVKITASATKLPDDIRQKIAQAQSKIANVKTARDGAKADVEKAKKFLEKVKEGSNAQAIQDAENALAKAEANLKVAEENLTRALAAVGSLIEQASLLDLDVKDGKCAPLTYNFKLELLEPEPDPNHKYRLDLMHLPWRDDVLNVAVNEKGLLSSAKLETTDRTADILIEIAKAVSAFVAPPSFTTLAVVPPKDRECPKPYKYEDLFDPTLKGDVDEVKARLMTLNANGPNFSVRVVGSHLADDQFSTSVTLPRNRFDLTPGTSAPGFLYRRLLPYVVSIVQDSIPIQSALVMLPNEGPVSVVPYTAGPFVKTLHDVEFKDGLLTKWTANKPSEFLAVVRLPVELAKASISVLAEIFQLRVNLTNQTTSLLEAQKAQIEAAEALRKLKEEIDRVQAKRTSSPQGGN